MSEYEQSILPIVQDTWDSMLQMPVDEDTSSLPDPAPLSFAGMVTISGAWQGAVGLYVTEALGRRAASAMFGTPETEVSTQDMQDALAELTNVVGGNLKALLPPPCQLGLPVVVEGTDYRMRVSGNTRTLTRRFRCHDQAFNVVVVERVAV